MTNVYMVEAMIRDGLSMTFRLTPSHHCHSHCHGTIANHREKDKVLTTHYVCWTEEGTRIPARMAGAIEPSSLPNVCTTPT